MESYQKTELLGELRRRLATFTFTSNRFDQMVYLFLCNRSPGGIGYRNWLHYEPMEKADNVGKSGCVTMPE